MTDFPATETAVSDFFPDDAGGSCKALPAEPDVPMFDGLVGESSQIRAVFKTIRKVSGSNATVLITGESGTGKELVARAIHENSPRRNTPMVVINCGAIPGELLESELFGHEKGAFTGAHRARMGRLELADGGTIFLDEIGDMSPSLQVKLLRAIQEQTFERVGSTEPVKVDIRIISATNKDLEKAVAEGDFREDLFYRLNVIPIKIPPLRERSSDILHLCRFFLYRFALRMQEVPKTLSDSVVRHLLAYRWPGNIRELENLMERMSVMAEDDVIREEDLPESIAAHADTSMAVDLSAAMTGMGFNEAVELFQTRLILDALEKSGWVKAKAAELLKMNRTTLVERIKKLGIEPPDRGDGCHE